MKHFLFVLLLLAFALSSSARETVRMSCGTVSYGMGSDGIPILIYECHLVRETHGDDPPGDDGCPDGCTGDDGPTGSHCAWVTSGTPSPRIKLNAVEMIAGRGQREEGQSELIYSSSTGTWQTTKGRWGNELYIEAEIQNVANVHGYTEMMRVSYTKSTSGGQYTGPWLTGPSLSTFITSNTFSPANSDDRSKPFMFNIQAAMYCNGTTKTLPPLEKALNFFNGEREFYTASAQSSESVDKGSYGQWKNCDETVNWSITQGVSFSASYDLNVSAGIVSASTGLNMTWTLSTTISGSISGSYQGDTRMILMTTNYMIWEGQYNYLGVFETIRSVGTWASPGGLTVQVTNQLPCYM